MAQQDRINSCVEKLLDLIKGASSAGTLELGRDEARSIGEILFHAEVEYDGNPADLNSWEITGDEHGFLGINTSHEYFQRVYMLTLVENE